MSSTKVKKIPLARKEPYNYDYDRELRPKLKTQMNVMWLVGLMVHHEFERVEYHGLEHVPTEGPFILCPNHCDGFDPFTIAYGMRKKKRELWFMCKSEFWQAFYIRVLLDWIGGFPVHRDRADLNSIKLSERILNNGNVLLVFPQGTRDRLRGRPTAESAFPGAMLVARETKAPVLPVSIHLDPDLNNPHPACVVRFGKMIPYEDLGFSEGKRRSRELKSATALVMDRIAEMWDLDRAKYE